LKRCGFFSDKTYGARASGDSVGAGYGGFRGRKEEKFSGWRKFLIFAGRGDQEVCFVFREEGEGDRRSRLRYEVAPLRKLDEWRLRGKMPGGGHAGRKKGKKNRGPPLFPGFWDGGDFDGDGKKKREIVCFPGGGQGETKKEGELLRNLGGGGTDDDFEDCYGRKGGWEKKAGLGGVLALDLGVGRGRF